jgi:hypothetical protein
VGLWVSTNVDHDRPGIQSWLLSVNVDAAGGCQQPAVVDGELDAGNASGEPASFTQTAEIALSASFARVMSVSVASGGDRRASGFSQPALGARPRWRPLHLPRFRDVYIAAGPVRFVGGRRGGELGGELVDRVLAHVPSARVSAGEVAFGRALASRRTGWPAAFDRGPVRPVAAGIVRAALTIELALIEPQPALGAL